MTIEKEYPATHSMATAWYFADEEGNVAIMDYNDNGPVPWETEETGIESLVYGHCENYDTNEYLTINLTDDQIDDLMENPHQPDEEDSWFDCIFRIDIEKEEKFLELTKNPDFNIELCISKKRGLYLIDCFDCTKDVGKQTVVIETSSLKRMIDEGIILQIYKAKDFFISDDWKDNKVVYGYHFSSAPYYIYKQPYWNELLADRINIPKNPVKLNQFPPALQRRVPRVPIKFSECQKIQIAEWLPCHFTTENVFIDGCEYGLLTLTNGTKAYVISDMDAVDFYPYCSEKEKYNCKKCSTNCATCIAYVFTDRPTVLMIVSPYSKFDYDKVIVSDFITQHTIMLPFLPRIPKPLGRYAFVEDAEKVVTPHMLETYFLKNSRYLEDMFIRYNPRVVIVDEKAFAVLRKRYSLENHVIEIIGKRYPLYLESEVETYREKIEQLADIPYQGRVFPHIISIEEMQKLKSGNND